MSDDKTTRAQAEQERTRTKTDDGSAERAQNTTGVQAEELEELRSRASERDQYLNMLQRTRAEFENYQKRNQKDREEERRYLHGSLVLDLLPVVDNLERALAAAKEAGEEGSLVQGVAIVHTQFLDLLKRYGVTRIEAQGREFDPNLHQALMQREVPDQPPNTVLDVVEQGYMIQDRVLRPAKVIVSK